MKFAQADTSNGLLINGYGTGHVQIGMTRFESSLLVAPDRLITDWRPQTSADLTQDDFTAVLALKPEILVLGTGARQVFPDPALYATVMNHGVGIEVMNTGAACRTYNVIMAEGRRVVAALMMI